MGKRLERAERLLALGLHRLGRDLPAACRAATLAHFTPAGGFRGRQGDADLWYTDFAVRTLTLAGAPREVFTTVAGWLRSQPPSTEQPALFNQLNLARLLATYGAPRVRAIAGSPPRPHLAQAPTSAYGLLLVAASCDLVGAPPPAGLAEHCAALERSDGGFAQQPGEGASQANATAAVLTALLLSGRLDRRIRRRAAGFLASQQGEDGGLRAHPAIPNGDLLSTFTAAWALAGADRLGCLRLRDLADFALRCRHPSGGFAATPDDGSDDPEYTYYGLALMALLRLQADTGDGILGRWRRFWLLH